jgi:hypothetical protein
MAATLVALPMKTLAQGGAVGQPTLLQAGSTTHQLKADAKEAEVLTYNGTLPGPAH